MAEASTWLPRLSSALPLTTATRYLLVVLLGLSCSEARSKACLWPHYHGFFSHPPDVPPSYPPTKCCLASQLHLTGMSAVTLTHARSPAEGLVPGSESRLVGNVAVGGAGGWHLNLEIIFLHKLACRTRAAELSFQLCMTNGSAGFMIPVR